MLNFNLTEWIFVEYSKGQNCYKWAVCDVHFIHTSMQGGLWLENQLIIGKMLLQQLVYCCCYLADIASPKEGDLYTLHIPVLVRTSLDVLVSCR